MTHEQLISPSYVDMQKVLHASPRGYGQKGRKWAHAVAHVLQRFNGVSVLDYGCGAASLGDTLRSQGIVCRDYDPAIPGKDALPSMADVVCTTDVLEHVEPERIQVVLGHIRQLARKAILAVVALDETSKVLTDGRNAHLIVKPQEWWIASALAAGWHFVDVPDLPIHLSAEKRVKRWIVVATP